MTDFLSSTITQFKYYKMLGDKTIERLSYEQLTYLTNGQSNSIAILVGHISGNMLSRWTNFKTEDGEKEWRNRDHEFELQYETKTQLIEAWEDGWSCLFDALNSTLETELEDLVYIRNQGHTIVEAINRQVAHYAYHIGQMVFVAKMVEDQWESLSIPKNKSQAFNDKKFKEEKQKGHFTDDFLEK